MMSLYCLQLLFPNVHISRIKEESSAEFRQTGVLFQGLPDERANEDLTDIKDAITVGSHVVSPFLNPQSILWIC
jgi:hypothetical protein